MSDIPATRPAHPPASYDRGYDSAPHVVPVSVYLAVFTALLVFTGVTVGVAFLDLGALNTVMALGIAVVKASLVILYFMHVRYGSRMIWVVVGAALYWLFHMIAGTVADYLSRGFLGTPGT
jgi:cytochrome c oxidase subunit 4